MPFAAPRVFGALNTVRFPFGAGFASVRRIVGGGGRCLAAVAVLAAAPAFAQQGTSISDTHGPRVIVPATRSTQVMVLNGDATLTGFSIANPTSYAVSCAAPGGLATSGGVSQTLAWDDPDNAAFQTGAGSTSPLAVGRGVPYSGTNCSSSPAVAAGPAGSAAMLSTVDIPHQRFYVVAAGASGSADTITAYQTTSVGYYQPSAQSLGTPLQANLDTGGTYTSLVADADGLNGDAVVTELRTASNAGGTWVFSSTFGTATRILGPGGVDLPAINSFIIHNPNDGGGGLLVLVNQDGLTASNLSNPPLDTTPFTVIDLGQLHDLLAAKNFPRSVTLPSVTTIPSSLGYYAMLGAVYNPANRLIYAVVGGGTSTTNIQRQIVAYDLSLQGAPTETVVNDVSSVPLSSAQATQLAVNAASGTLQMLAKDSARLFSAGITAGGPAVSEITGSTFNDSNFTPSYIAANPLLGETYVASTGQVDVLTRPTGTKKLAVLDMTGPEVQQTVGAGSVQLLGLFPDISDTALSTTPITITATPVIGGSPFTFATVNASQTLTYPKYVSGTFPAANIYTLVASFPGDAQYAPATSAPVVVAVGQAYFSTAISATATFNGSTGAGTATVTLSGSTYVPGGTITVKSVNTGSTLATLYLSGGISNPMVIPFTAPPSTTAIVVAYSGDSKNQPSTTGNVQLTQVALVTPTFTGTVPASAAVGSSAHINVVFHSTTTNVPTGKVAIFASSASVSYVAIGAVDASAAFAAGGAGLDWTPQIPDTYSVYASYAGDSSYNQATGQIGTIAVTGGVYAFTLSAPSTALAATPFNVVVNASSGLNATGNVTVQAYKLGSTTPVSLGSVSASAAAATGGATLAATVPASGVYTLVGSYAGDANYAAASSANTPTVNVTGGTTPSVTLTPASVNLTIPVGTSFQRSFVLYNSGGAGLNITSIAVSGQGFSQVNGCPAVLAAGANCTINVTFAPLAAGTVTGLLSVIDNATGSPHTAALTGTGTPGAATVSPATVNFIDQTVGTGSFLRPQVTLSNTGTAAFTITSVSLNPSPDFEINTNQCASAGSLSPGGSCTVTLEFHPTTPGAKMTTLAFTTSNSTVPQSVTLTGNGLSGNPATPPNCADADGDGLCDDWETNGVWVRTSATSEKFINLPAMGADPKHKDIFIQADYMATAYVPTGDHTHKLKPTAQAQLVAAFEAAPVTNPDGKTGIHLHIDCGYDCTMDTVKKTTWGSLSQAQEVQEVTPFDTVNVGRAANFDWTKFDAASTTFTASGRNLVFHHLIMAHDLRAQDSTSGISRNASTFPAFLSGASDFVVSLGSWTTDMMGTSLNQAATLMHELGHNLGLEHGGRTEDNYKPNYLSVMNYNMQIQGLIIDSQNGYIDYSRFNLPNMDETHVNEQTGLNVTVSDFPGQYGGKGIDHYGTYYFCIGANPSKVAPQGVTSVNGKTNWNCNYMQTKNGTNVTNTPYFDPAPVKTDVNADGAATVLTSFNDWPALVYTGGSVGGNGVGTVPPSTTSVVEVTEEQASLAQPLFAVSVTGVSRVRSAPNSHMTLRFLVKNTGQTSDTYTLSTTMQNGWVINTPAPASVSVAAGAQTEVTVSYTVPATAADGTSDKLVLTAVSQTAPQITDSLPVETYAVSSPFPDSISTANVNFGSATVATASAAQGVVVLNTGTSALSFGSITTTAEFAQTNNCGATLAAGASCTITLTFTPAATDARTGTLTINDGTGTAKTVALKGTGVPPVLPIPAVILTTTPSATSTGQAVTLTVNVAAVSPVATGTVTITDGTTQYGQVTLDASGTGTLTTRSLGSGNYSLYAVYSGDANYQGSNSAYATLSLVAAAPTTVVLTSSAPYVATGAGVTFTATIGGGSGTSQPSGTVQFLDGTTVLGTGTLNATGVATYTTSTLSAGAHSVTASYGGDTVFGASVSSAVIENVGVFATANKLTSSATTAVTVSAVTFTSTLTSPAGTPTGSVTFMDGTATLGTGTLNASGVATLTTSALAIGTHSITSVYAATGNFGASTSSAVQVVVTGAPDFSVSANPTSLQVASGASASAVFTVTPVNGYAGTLSFTCGTLPSYATCTFSPAKLTFTSTTQTPQSTTLTFGTGQSTALLGIGSRGLRGTSPVAFAMSLPLGMLALGFGWRTRKARRPRMFYGVVAAVLLAGAAGLTGCGNSASTPAKTPAGTYTVPVTVSDGTSSHSISYTITVN